MRSYLSALFTGIILSLSLTITAQNLKNNASQPLRSIDDKGLHGITVSYELNGFNSFEKTENEEAYSQLSIPGFGHLDAVGKPSMPAYIDYIAIPDGASYQLSIETRNTQSTNFGKVYPALEPARDTEGAPNPSFEIDEETYQSDRYYPAESVEIIDEVIIRGLRMAVVRIQPLQYNPKQGTLKTNNIISYTLHFKGGTRFIRPEEHSDNFLSMLKRYPLNGASLEKKTSSKSIKSSFGATPNYIILTHSNYIDAADSLALWKKQMGYEVEIVTASTWSSNDVKQAIHTRYQNYTPKPDYFVIIGDHGDVPAYMKTNSQGDPFGTDLYYVCMDGSSDYVADMARGRISVNSATQAMNVVMKIIHYERHPIQDSTFYSNGLNCAQFQDDDQDGYAERRFTHTSENVRDYMLSQGYKVRRVYQTDNNVYPSNYNSGYYSNGQSIPNNIKKINGYPWNGNAGHIKSALDSGKFYILHRDHGYAGGTGWAHPQFMTGNINQLANGNRLPVVFSINCHTGEFTLSNCFAENFLRQSSGGAVGVFGASYYSYSGYNDGLSLGFFDAIWSNPGVIPSFGSGGVANPNVTAHSDIIRMGDVMNHALIRVAQTWGGNNSGRRYTNELFHYFGDPAMIMWTEQPDSITATHASIISCNDTALMLSGINENDVLATLVGNQNLISKAVIQNGSGYIPLAGLQGNELTLTLTKRNCIPYIANIQVAPGGSLTVFKNVVHNQCNGDTSASIEVLPTCGYPPYTIQWSNGDTIAKIENLIAGDYIVTINDSMTTYVDTITITQPASAVVANGSVTDAKCNFESSGSINLNVTGGTPPYAFQWSHGYTGSNPVNLAANTYTVDVTDQNSCVATKTFIVQQPPAIIITTSSVSDTNSQCIGVASASIAGGVLPYTFSWNDPNNQTTLDATGLCSGLYKITVTDSNNCLKYRTTYVDNYSDVSIQENVGEIEVKVYPNPSSSGNFTVKFEQAIPENTHIEVYDAQGKRVYSTLIKGNGLQTFQLKLEDVSSGIYHLRIFSSSGDFHLSKELIIE